MLWAVLSRSVVSLCDPMDYSPSGSSVHGDSPGKNTGVGCLPPGDLLNPGTEPRSPTFQENTLLSEPLEKCKNSSGDLQDQGINQGLLHCRWILYNLSPQGSLRILDWAAIPSPADIPDPGIKPGSTALQAHQLSY